MPLLQDHHLGTLFLYRIPNHKKKQNFERITKNLSVCILSAYTQELEKMDSDIEENHRANYAEMPQNNSPIANLKITTSTWNSVKMETHGVGTELFQADHYGSRWLGKVRKLISTTKGSSASTSIV